MKKKIFSSTAHRLFPVHPRLILISSYFLTFLFWHNFHIFFTLLLFQILFFFIFFFIKNSNIFQFLVGLWASIILTEQKKISSSFSSSFVRRQLKVEEDIRINNKSVRVNWISKSANNFAQILYSSRQFLFFFVKIE